MLSWFTNDCSPTQFLCDSGECVVEDEVCDESHDCRDASDEEDCGLILKLSLSPLPRLPPLHVSNYCK